jgi:L-histidine Nalpha-methyltransferase
MLEPVAPRQREAESRLFDLAPAKAATLAEVAVERLFATPRSLPSFLLYDAEGSRLFSRIMELPEYYLTRTEREILERNANAIVEPLRGQRVMVIDVGAGDGTKTRILVDALRRAGSDVAYAAVDVSVDALEDLAARTREQLPDVVFEGVVAHYEDGVRFLAGRHPDRKRLALFLGSNVGNLVHTDARALFRSLSSALKEGDHALVGFDLLKDPETLRRAYDDSAGVTAAFNLNLLRRLNRELGADFDLSAFRHHAFFDPRRSALESWLVSTRAQRIEIAGRTLELAAWEGIQTETAFKYREHEITAFASDAGFQSRAVFSDRERRFVDALWMRSADGPPR